MSQSSLSEASDLPLLLTVRDLAVLLQIGRNNAYEMCHRPGFPSFRLGKQVRIPRDALMRWLEAQASPESHAPPPPSGRLVASLGK